MFRITVLILTLTAASAAFGHDQGNAGVALLAESLECEATNGADSGGITSCSHLCDMHDFISGNYEFCTSPASDPLVNFDNRNSGVQCYQQGGGGDPFSPIPPGMSVCADDVLSDNNNSFDDDFVGIDLSNSTGRGNDINSNNDRDNNSQTNSNNADSGNTNNGNADSGNTNNGNTDSGNTANNNQFGDQDGVDIDFTGDLNIGNGPTYQGGDGGGTAHDESTNYTDRSSQTITDGAVTVTDGDADLCGGRDACDQEMNNSGNSNIDRSGNSANFNTDLSTQTITDGAVTVTDSSTQTITDGANTMTTGAITDGNVTVTDGDIDQTITDGDQDVTVTDGNVDNANENESESTSSTDDSGNSRVKIDQSDNSVYTNASTSVYNEAYRAPMLATQLNVSTSHCINFIGLQFSGAKSNGAAAFGLGWPKADEECRLEKSAILAFQMENYEAGWTAYCSQKSTRKAWVARMKAEGMKRHGRKGQALLQCMQTGLDVQQTLQNIHDELELLRNELGVMKDVEFDDSPIKARIDVLERAAHNPTETFLLRGSR